MIDPYHKPLPHPVIIPMSKYSCFGSMSGKLWMITQKAEKPNANKARK
jgi:hypothetical protein